MVSNKYGNVMRKLYNARILCERRDIGYGLNKVRSHQHKRETFSHFIVKAILAKLCMVKGDSIITEHELPDGCSMDVLQIKDKSLIAYEVESEDKEHDRDIDNVDQITIKLKDLPPNVKRAISTMEEYFKELIV